MVDPAPGDVVTTDQARIDMVRVLAPVVPGAYTLTLRGRAFVYTAQPADTPAIVTAGLAAELLDEQTYVSILVDDADLFVAGPVGSDYAISTPMAADRMEVRPVQPAIRGDPTGPLRVLKARVYWTKDLHFGADATPTRKIKLTVRRDLSGPVNVAGAPSIDYSTDPVFDLDWGAVRTVLSRAATGPASPFESIA